MATIDFRHFKLFSGISQEKSFVTDVSATLADLIYKSANGIMAHDIALRIYRSEEPVEFDERELSFLKSFVREQTTPMFIDSFNENLAKAEK